MVLGLWWQARDIRRALQSQTGLSRNERWTWRVEVLWRWTAALLLVGYYLVLCLSQLQILPLPERSGDVVPSGWQMRFAIPYLVLAVVLDRGRTRPAYTPPKWRGRIISVVGALAAVWLCLLVWSYGSAVSFVVYISIMGFELATPLRFAPAGLKPSAWVRGERFLAVSIAACILVLLNLILVTLLARQWHRGPRRRLVWEGLLCTGLTASAASAVWIVGPGLYHLSPYYAVEREWGAPHLWVTAVLLVAVLTAAAALRWRGSPDQPVAPLPLPAERPHAYYHDRPGLLALLVLAVLVANFPLTDVGSFHEWLESVAMVVFALPYSCLPLAVLLLAIGRLIHTLRTGPAGLPTPTVLVPGRFLAVWSTLFLTVIFGLPAIAAFSMMVWLAPKHLFPWPVAGR
jgi:hypothetical protein